MRQIAEVFITPDSSHFPNKQFNNLHIASMTQIDKKFDIPVAFPPQVVKNTLGSTLSKNNKNQVRIAETQKYAHVTFFFNGLKDAPYPNEYRILIPSQTVSRQEEHPEMMADEITTRLTGAIEENAFDFILANYANADMVAHTGDLNATVKAIQIVDQQLARVLQTAFKHNATLLITSDHGNAERLFNPRTGKVETKHDINPVPIYLVGPKYYRPVSENEIAEREKVTIGLLSDIAPTILELMGIQKPAEMTGSSLLRQLMR
jgi:2,3-bisphosphoglycerate-independent phosphoglycerate mutase